MKIYIAICKTKDPEVDDSSEFSDILGAFSSREWAQKAFKDSHICCEGIHEIQECDLNRQYSQGIDYD